MTKTPKKPPRIGQDIHDLLGAIGCMVEMKSIMAIHIYPGHVTVVEALRNDTGQMFFDPVIQGPASERHEYRVHIVPPGDTAETSLPEQVDAA